jgi:hypothetical protein
MGLSVTPVEMTQFFVKANGVRANSKDKREPFDFDQWLPRS